MTRAILIGCAIAALSVSTAAQAQIRGPNEPTPMSSVQQGVPDENRSSADGSMHRHHHHHYRRHHHHHHHMMRDASDGSMQHEQGVSGSGLPRDPADPH